MNIRTELMYKDEPVAVIILDATHNITDVLEVINASLLPPIAQNKEAAELISALCRWQSLRQLSPFREDCIKFCQTAHIPQLLPITYVSLFDHYWLKYNPDECWEDICPYTNYAPEDDVIFLQLQCTPEIYCLETNPDSPMLTMPANEQAYWIKQNNKIYYARAEAWNAIDLAKRVQDDGYEIAPRKYMIFNQDLYAVTAIPITDDTEIISMAEYYEAQRELFDACENPLLACCEQNEIPYDEQIIGCIGAYNTYAETPCDLAHIMVLRDAHTLKPIEIIPLL